MVIHEQKPGDAGLYVDFSEMTGRTNRTASNWIAYHDEAQLEICRDQVQEWKCLKTRPLCKAFKSDDGKSLVRPRITTSGWFRGSVRLAHWLQKLCKSLVCRALE
jgi:hypothetical protein